MTENPSPTNEDGTGNRTKTCDASGMAMIHRMFSSSYGEAPGLVRGVREGDHGHSATVADHLELLSRALHAHHEGEDQRLWPALNDRAPGCALHVARMKDQHREILARVEELDAVVPVWRASASAVDAARVVRALDGVNAALAAHLPDEETNIVPVMEHTITKAGIEWFSEHGRKATRGYTWPSLGLILAAQPDGGDTFLREDLPAPVRLLWRWIGKRKYAQYRAALTGV
jgi:hypothetical protein